MKDFPPNIPVSRADRFVQDTRPKDPNTGTGGPKDTSKDTVPKNPNTGTGKPKDNAAKPGNGHVVPAIVVENADGAKAHQATDKQLEFVKYLHEVIVKLELKPVFKKFQSRMKPPRSVAAK